MRTRQQRSNKILEPFCLLIDLSKRVCKLDTKTRRFTRADKSSDHLKNAVNKLAKGHESSKTRASKA